jgi:hypothetical protein
VPTVGGSAVKASCRRIHSWGLTLWERICWWRLRAELMLGQGNRVFENLRVVVY